MWCEAVGRAAWEAWKEEVAVAKAIQQLQKKKVERTAAAGQEEDGGPWPKSRPKRRTLSPNADAGEAKSAIWLH